MMRTGPNDASGVVWAIGEFFPPFPSCFLYILIIVLYIYSCNLQNMRQGGHR